MTSGAIVEPSAAAIEAARAGGATRVAIAEVDLSSAQVDRLCAAGLSDARLAMHGASAAGHDLHAGPGAFDRAIGTMAALRARSVALAAWSALTRSSARSLIELPDWLHAHGVTRWLIVLPRVQGEPFTRAVPRLALGLSPALHALDRASRLGLAAFVGGAPRCALGPFAARALPSPARAFAPVCARCAARNDCCGIEASYLARFGAGELHPREPIAPAIDQAWIFAGLEPSIDSATLVVST